MIQWYGWDVMVVMGLHAQWFVMRVGAVNKGVCVQGMYGAACISESTTHPNGPVIQLGEQ